MCSTFYMKYVKPLKKSNENAILFMAVIYKSKCRTSISNGFSSCSLEIFPSLLQYYQPSFTWNLSFFTLVPSDPLNKSSCPFLVLHYRLYCMPYAPRPSWSESSLLSTFPVAKEFFLNFFSTGFENLRHFFQYLFTSNFWRFCIIYLHYTVS